MGLDPNALQNILTLPFQRQRNIFDRKGLNIPHHSYLAKMHVGLHPNTAVVCGTAP